MNFKFTKYMIAGLLLFSSLAFAQTAQTLLQNDLEKAVKYLPTETYFYHYFILDTGAHRIEDTTLQHLDGRQKYVDSRLALGGKVFRDFSRRSTAFSNAGPGVYLATDPFASSPAASKDTGGFFGDSMVEIKMRAGTRYLSLFTPASLSTNTVNALIAEGYLTRESSQRLIKGNKFSRDTLKFMVGYGIEDFRKLVADLLLNMNVNIIEYAWQSGVSALCDWKDIRSAFVYIASQTPSDVVDANMVYWKGFSSKVTLSYSEQDALQRSKTLHPLLSKLRILEKKMKATKGTSARTQIRAEADREIKATFFNPSDLYSLKQHTFKCN